MNFNKIIKELKAEKPENKEEALELKQDIKTFSMLKKIKEKKVKTKKDFERACGALCYESLAFCCDITKPCLHRNAVLDALGISMKEFRERKMKLHGEFVERFGG